MLNFGLIRDKYIAFGATEGHCITQGTDGTNFGIKRSLPTAFGAVDPERTFDGVLIYDFYCQTSGEVVLRLGDDGELEVQGVIAIRIFYEGGELDLLWVGLENMYVGNDSVFTDYATAIPVDSVYCVEVARVPTPLPEAPQNFRVLTSDATSIVLTWDIAVEGAYPIGNYEVVAGDVLIGSPGGTSLQWDSVPPNVEVSYHVRAIDDRGNAGNWSDTLVYTNVVP